MSDTFVLLHTYVAGVQHYVPTPVLWGSVLPHGKILQLERELDNQYDKYAVKILLAERKIGYIPRELAPMVWALIKNGYTVHAEVDDVNERNKRYPTVGIALCMPPMENTR